MRLSGIIDTIVAEMDKEEELRERSFQDARRIIRISKRAVQAIHRDEDPRPYLEEAHRRVADLSAYLSGSSVRGAAEDAMMEMTESFILNAVLEKKEIPSPQELGVNSRAWVLGLADVPGELRRRCLDLMRDGKIEEADLLLQKMEEIHEAIMAFDHPDAVLPIRHKQDVSRSVLERTRGDIATALALLHLRQ
ncbi:MAG: translin [Candidatus Methanomethylophilaceae archaeon]|nr:translin [Candidatus Methanomethylophilaceae archaeon]